MFPTTGTENSMLDVGKLDSFSIFSQHGEDGLLWSLFREIASVMPISKTCVDVGAGNGTRWSNTAHLITMHNWTGVLIEPSRKEFRKLKNYAGRYQSLALRKYVTAHGESSLDRLLQSTSIPSDFDLLSIDVDGDEINILRELSAYFPKVIVVEFNPTFPNEIEHLSTLSETGHSGSSLRAVYNALVDKGYSPLAVVGVNLIALRSDISNVLLDDKIFTIDELRDDTEFRVYASVGYDGKLYLSNTLQFPWHGFVIHSATRSFLPKYLVGFPPNYSTIQFLLFGVHLLVGRPSFLKSTRELARQKLTERVRTLFSNQNK